MPNPMNRRRNHPAPISRRRRIHFDTLEGRQMLSTVVRDLPEFSGQTFETGSQFPRPSVQVGTIDLGGEISTAEVRNATISGTFGNSVYPHTAAVTVYLDGIPVASSPESSTTTPVTWSYTLSGEELDVLRDGVAEITAVQTSRVNIRLGPIHFEASTDAALDLKIVSASQSTFVVTDTITFRANAGVARPGVRVFWSVQGRGAAAGIGGFPTDIVTTTDEAGNSSFSFRPADNPGLVSDRHTRWTAGSYQANAPIGFEVKARAVLDAAESSTSLTASGLGPLIQDESDTLRQEYFDYNATIPPRSIVVPSLGTGFNRGNYGVQLSVGLRERYDAILAAYIGQRVRITVGGRRYNVTIPNGAPVTISSGYRNPQRNKAVGSLYPTGSKHTLGSALDLVPGAVQVRVRIGRRFRNVSLSVHGTLYPALQRAASTQGTAFAENSNAMVALGSSAENHIHVQWN